LHVSRITNREALLPPVEVCGAEIFFAIVNPFSYLKGSHV
jgi:hypothetical protein